MNYFKNLESSNIQDTDEILAFVLRIESSVNTSHEPLKHAVVNGFGKSCHSIDDLQDITTLLHRQLMRLHTVASFLKKA